MKKCPNVLGHLHSDARADLDMHEPAIWKNGRKDDFCTELIGIHSGTPQSP
jgi:hypothetical protein